LLSALEFENLGLHAGVREISALPADLFGIGESFNLPLH